MNFIKIILIVFLLKILDSLINPTVLSYYTICNSTFNHLAQLVHIFIVDGTSKYPHVSAFMPSASQYYVLIYV